ncbi:response regulator [Enterococcus sp. RIT-PI-f]|uniref:response regulator n=1 Tax=Enterococcus sp. RIT-PI-f TaxID=1690244 RepID=UPI0006B87F67|nr:response regulator [Enterococcus sp. RIT-PI-f]KPG73780.1 transcriptional regulator [Enterococcus sp. RIT-PI-f]
MKNVIVVDDEALIANGVAKLVQTFDLPLTIKKIFTDSEEALAYCQSTPIDIAITDINMPNLNGLELIKQLKEINPTIQIIILTGFGSFTFAKEAMSLGVKFFLEKPILPDKMRAALLETSQLSERRKLESKLYLKRQIEQFINSCGEECLPDEVSFPFCLYVYDSKFYHAIAKRIEQYSKQHELIAGHQNKVGYIINFSVTKDFNTFFKERIQSTPLGKGIAINCLVDSPEKFLTSYHLGKRHLDKAFYFDTFEVIHESQISQENLYENHLYIDYREKLLSLIIKGELTRSQVLTENFFSTCRMELYPVQLLRLQINDLLSVLFENYRIKKDIYFDDYSPKIMLLNHWQELQFMLIHFIDLMRHNLGDNENMQLSQKVNLIIEEYYDREALSLKWIANHLLYLNPEYLGKTYYKETGTRFNQKLAEYRIKKAQDLLKKNYKVYEVASLTGFSNAPEYFVQTFKKITGVTPKKFLSHQQNATYI